MATAAEITRAKLEAIEDVPLAWAKSIEAYQPRLLNRLSKLINELDTVDGQLVKSAANLTRISTIISELRDYLTSGEYVKIVEAFNNEFTAQQAVTASYFGQVLEVEPIVTTFNAQLYQLNRAAALEGVLSNATLDSMLLNDVRSTLIEAVGSNARFGNTYDALQDLVIGNAEKEGQLLRYSRQIVSDTFATTDRAYTQLISEEYQFQWFRWLGGKMKTTRCLCLNLNGRYLSKGELEKIGAFELSIIPELASCRTGNGWAGAMPNTNSQTIFVTAGGYNCQHSILPVSTFGVPKEDIVRAVKNGTFKPTPSESEYFNLGSSDFELNVSNNTNLSFNTSEIATNARKYAEELGLKGNVSINIKNSDFDGGGVSWGKPVNNRMNFKPNIEIDATSKLTQRQVDEIIRHEMTHLKQNQSNRMFLQKDAGTWNIYWDGKPYMSMKEYTRLTNRFQGKASYKVRQAAYKKYRELPWEAEAHLAGDPFR